MGLAVALLSSAAQYVVHQLRGMYADMHEVSIPWRTPTGSTDTSQTTGGATRLQHGVGGTLSKLHSPRRVFWTTKQLNVAWLQALALPASMRHSLLHPCMLACMLNACRGEQEYERCMRQLDWFEGGRFGAMRYEPNRFEGKRVGKQKACGEKEVHGMRMNGPKLCTVAVHGTAC